MNNSLTRQTRTRRHIAHSGRPRLSVFRSSAHIWAQIIDDGRGVTLAAANDLELKGNKTSRAEGVGIAIAALAKQAKLTQIVFDRGGYRYHGRVKALAEAARKAGLEF